MGETRITYVEIIDIFRQERTPIFNKKFKRHTDDIWELS